MANLKDCSMKEPTQRDTKPFNTAKFRITYDGKSLWNIGRKPVEWFDEEVEQHVCYHWLIHKFWSNAFSSDANEVDVYTTWKLHGSDLIRGDPVSGWHDWVVVQWTSNRKQVHCFAQVVLYLKTPKNFPNCIIDEMLVTANNMYALMHILGDYTISKLPPAHETSKLVRWGKKEMNGNMPQLYLFPIESITRTAIGLPGDPSKHNILQEEYMILLRRSEWFSLYQKHMARNLSHNTSP
jgi:hypothetical protein